MTGDAKIWAPQDRATEPDRWWAEVVEIGRQHHYAPWFTADRAAWMQLYRAGYSPVEAIRANREALG